MRAGELDRRIVIETSAESQDSTGAMTRVWSTFATVSARVRPAGGRERNLADRDQAEADLMFRIRWLSGVTRVMRVSYDGALYDIARIDEIGRREGLEIFGKAQVT